MISDNASNKTKIWGIAAAAGVIAFLLLKIAASYSFWPALLLAILIAVLVAILLWIGFYRDPEVDSAEAPSQRASLASGSVTAGTTASAAPPTATTPPAAKPAAAKKLAKPAKPAAAPKPKAAQSEKNTDAKSGSAMMGDAGNKMVAEKKAAKATAATPAAKPAAASDKPELLTAARAGGPDDLKQIKGVGPKLEGELHKMGVYHFDQIAGWTKKEVEWMDESLAGVRQRVSRDEWVTQAKVLAEGGQTEFSKRVKKGGVY